MLRRHCSRSDEMRTHTGGRTRSFNLNEGVVGSLVLSLIARVWPFLVPQKPPKKSKASGGPGTLMQSSVAEILQRTALSLFWPQAAGDCPPNPAQCLRQTMCGAKKRSSELRPFPPLDAARYLGLEGV